MIGTGEVLMELVPTGDELLVEAKLEPKHVGHMFIGQPVEVKVSSVEYRHFGTIQGNLAKISATTYFDNAMGSFYLAEIKLGQAFVGEWEEKSLIVPSMTVQAYILTGEKSILSYLL